MPKGIPLTEAEQSVRREEIFQVAVQLFVRNGFQETSMREIAEAAGIGKSTLYDYFTTKDEILVAYFEKEIQALTAQAQNFTQRDLSAKDKLIGIMEAHLETILAHKEFYIRLTMEMQRLGMDSQQRIHANRHVYQDILRQLVEDGIREGSFRPIDSGVAMRIIIGLLSPVIFTTRPSGTPREMLASSLDILFKGIEA